MRNYPHSKFTLVCEASLLLQFFFSATSTTRDFSHVRSVLTASHLLSCKGHCHCWSIRFLICGVTLSSLQDHPHCSKVALSCAEDDQITDNASVEALGETRQGYKPHEESLRAIQARRQQQYIISNDRSMISSPAA